MTEEKQEIKSGRKIDLKGFTLDGHYEIDFLKVSDMLWAVLDEMGNESRLDMLERILAHEKTVKLLAELVAGENLNDDYWFSSGRIRYDTDKLRKALLPHADAAAQTLVVHLLEQIGNLESNLQEAINLNKKVKEQWPTGFEKYYPETSVCFSRLHPYKSDAIKLIEHYREKAKEDDLID